MSSFINNEEKKVQTFSILAGIRIESNKIWFSLGWTGYIMGGSADQNVAQFHHNNDPHDENIGTPFIMTDYIGLLENH